MINIFMTQYNSSNKSWNFTIDNISSYNNSDITFNNDLSLNGTANIQNNLNIYGDISCSNTTTTYTSNSTITNTGTLTVTGVTNLLDNVDISGNLIFNTNNGQANILSQSQTELNLFSNSSDTNSYGYIQLNRNSSRDTIIGGEDIIFKVGSTTNYAGTERFKIDNSGVIYITGSLKIDNVEVPTINTTSLSNYTLTSDLYTRSELQSGNLDLSFQNVDISDLFVNRNLYVSGNTGIGITNPTTKLEVNGDISCSAITCDGNIQLNSNNQSKIIFYDKQNNHEHAEIRTEGIGINGGQLLFYTKEDEGNLDERMVITNEGAVGIGVSFPEQQLHVNGGIKINNRIYGTNNQIELFTATTAVNSHSFIEMIDTITSIGCPTFRVLTNSTTAGVGTDALNILANGNVGINNTNPSVKLDVNGDIKVNDTILGTSQQLEFYTNTSSTNSYGFIEMRSSKCTFGGPVLEFYINSSTTSYGSRIINAENNRVAINKGSGSPTHTLEVNGDIKGGDQFYVNDILHKRNSSSNYEISTQTGGTYNRKGKLALTDTEATLYVVNSNGTNAAYLQLYPQDSLIYHSLPFQYVSDDRLKSYEKDISNATNTIMKLKPKFYKKHPTLITDDPTPDLSGVVNFDEYGFVAQELNEDPELSHFVNKHSETEMYHVNYVDMIPLLVQTIKELNERIKVLESRL